MALSITRKQKHFAKPIRCTLLLTSLKASLTVSWFEKERARRITVKHSSTESWFMAAIKAVCYPTIECLFLSKLASLHYAKLRGTWTWVSGSISGWVMQLGFLAWEGVEEPQARRQCPSTAGELCLCTTLQSWEPMPDQEHKANPESVDHNLGLNFVIHQTVCYFKVCWSQRDYFISKTL